MTAYPERTESLRLGGRAVRVRLRRSRRARRIGLNVDVRLGGVEVVVPMRASRAEALAFVQAKAAWIHARLDALPRRVPFAEGAAVPVLGVLHTIRLSRQRDLFAGVDPRAGVEVRGRKLLVGGTPDEAARRVEGWLRARAEDEIGARARRTGARIGRRAARITLRDPRSRWGSCSARGALSFSWRLVLAPESVLDYVVAHEVAHLVEMNHGPRFWALVRSLICDVDQARAWLRANGEGLHAYG